MLACCNAGSGPGLQRSNAAKPCLRLPVRVRTQTGASHRQAQRRDNASQKLCAFDPQTIGFSR
ncbi:MAG: hypothetical protein JXA79_00270 [Deltaproteobacteria bacterium]|nr:hypothetical protein [Deltaproteobacteria bacterium]